MSAIEQLNIYTLSGNQGLSAQNIYQLASGNGHLANYDLELFLAICPEFKQNFDNNPLNRLNILFTLYCDNGKKVFSRELYGDSSVFCLSWYIAHYLEISLNNMKNEGNNANLNSTSLPNNMNYGLGGKEKKSNNLDNGLKEDLYRTNYGRSLYEYMRVAGMFSVRGVY